MLRSLVGSEMCIRDRVYDIPGDSLNSDAGCLKVIDTYRAGD